MAGASRFRPPIATPSRSRPRPITWSSRSLATTSVAGPSSHCPTNSGSMCRCSSPRRAGSIDAANGEARPRRRARTGGLRRTGHSVEGAAWSRVKSRSAKARGWSCGRSQSSGLDAGDSNRQTAAIEQLADAADAAVLVVRPYQTFRFVRPPYRLTFSASELPQEATAEVRAALRIADRETTLDAAVMFRPQGPPLYRVRLFCPTALRWAASAPAIWNGRSRPENGRQLLTVHLLDGRTDEFTLTLTWQVSRRVDRADSKAPSPGASSPRIEILDVTKTIRRNRYPARPRYRRAAGRRLQTWSRPPP